VGGIGDALDLGVLFLGNLHALSLISLVFVFLFRDDAMVGVRFRREISSAFALI
jgi:hypothetical protein